MNWEEWIVAQVDWLEDANRVDDPRFTEDQPIYATDTLRLSRDRDIEPMALSEGRRG